MISKKCKLNDIGEGNVTTSDPALLMFDYAIKSWKKGRSVRAISSLASSSDASPNR